MKVKEECVRGVGCILREFISITPNWTMISFLVSTFYMFSFNLYFSLFNFLCTPQEASKMKAVGAAAVTAVAASAAAIAAARKEQAVRENAAREAAAKKKLEEEERKKKIEAEMIAAEASRQVGVPCIIFPPRGLCVCWR